jgi:hypothetical protein
MVAPNDSEGARFRRLRNNWPYVMAKNGAFGSIYEENRGKRLFLKVHDFTDRCPKKCTILPIAYRRYFAKHTALYYAKIYRMYLYRRNPSLYDKAAVICGKQGGGDDGMIPIVLTIIAGYVAIGIAVVAALNYGMVERKSRLGSIGEWVRIVLAWPVVVLIVWLLR